MEKYIDRNAITSVQKYERKFICEINRVYKKPWKLFGLIPITKEKYVYQYDSKEYDKRKNYFNTFDDAYEYGFFVANKYKYEFDGEKIYLKPNVTVVDNNGNEYKKTFDTEKELDSYIQSLGLNISKNYITIKTD